MVCSEIWAVSESGTIKSHASTHTSHAHHLGTSEVSFPMLTEAKRLPKNISKENLPSPFFCAYGSSSLNFIWQCFVLSSALDINIKRKFWKSPVSFHYSFHPILCHVLQQHTSTVIFWQLLCLTLWKILHPIYQLPGCHWLHMRVRSWNRLKRSSEDVGKKNLSQNSRSYQLKSS